MPRAKRHSPGRPDGRGGGEGGGERKKKEEEALYDAGGISCERALISIIAVSIGAGVKY